MPIEYAIDDSMLGAVSDMISNEEYTEFDQIRAQEIRVLVAAMTKTNTDGEIEPTSGDSVVIRKVAPADKVHIDGHFKLYICRKRWDDANDMQRKAMLHRGLMRINIEPGEAGIKIGTRKPDVITFQATIVRFGAWEEDLIQLRNNLQSAQAKAKEAARAANPGQEKVKKAA